MKKSRGRRQYRSCDQCRKGKRACDAEVRSPKYIDLDNQSRFCENRGPCSNCKRWRKECTFDWLRSKRPATHEQLRITDPVQLSPLYNMNSSDICQDGIFQEESAFQALQFDSFQIPFRLPHIQAPLVSDEQDPPLDVAEDFSSKVSDPCRSGPWGVDNYLGSSLGEMKTHPLASFLDSETCIDSSPCMEYPSSHQGMGLAHAGSVKGLHPSRVFASEFSQGLETGDNLFPNLANSFYGFQTNSWVNMNDNLTDVYTRSVMKEGLLRIYHDSMENALSCWLTERNCPYTEAEYSYNRPHLRKTSDNSIHREWGPKWSNRICNRIHRLDAASSLSDGRQLTVTEKRKVFRALHITILAFASQWTRNTQGRRRYFDILSDQFSSDDTAHSKLHDVETSPIFQTERSIRENLWNQAYNSLNNCEGIFSFQVIFANILFSLTQRPLDINEHVKSAAWRRGQPTHETRNLIDQNDCGNRELDELQTIFENDCSPSFLDTALRQLFSFRYRLTGFQKHKHQLHKSFAYPQPQRHTSVPATENNLESLEQILLQDTEHYDTFNLLFWLGVMFDTLTAALHQRPPVVSDEDSQVNQRGLNSSSSLRNHDGNDIDLDGWHVVSESGFSKSKRSIWGELFLEKRISTVPGQINVSRWPCSYHEAAEILSDAAPVKVLLFRKVSRLQTLLYRGTVPESVEKAIQDTFHVYYYWHQTYGQFILDCVANHNELPFRIRSWYMILAGHWHLAAMLFADILEYIDNAHMGLDSQRESRLFTDIATDMKRQNALAVSDIAKCSLNESDLPYTNYNQFHESLNEGALLTEPWTIILVRSFTKASLNLLQRTGFFSNDYMDKAQCCIDALWRLGRKSDMSYLAAHLLTQSLNHT